MCGCFSVRYTASNKIYPELRMAKNSASLKTAVGFFSPEDSVTNSEKLEHIESAFIIEKRNTLFNLYEKKEGVFAETVNNLLNVNCLEPIYEKSEELITMIVDEKKISGYINNGNFIPLDKKYRYLQNVQTHRSTLDKS